MDNVANDVLKMFSSETNKYKKEIVELKKIVNSLAENNLKLQNENNALHKYVKIITDDYVKKVDKDDKII